MAGLAMEAPPMAHNAAPFSPLRQFLKRLDAEAPPAPVQRVMVWRGADIDGDGAADFANPTGAARAATMISATASSAPRATAGPASTRASTMPRSPTSQSRPHSRAM
ncbi:hypothetical protein [Caulobacter sp. B11]|uniref:hypothetical protein n=1 Tax=Caulobacter sp. B11 TaxID=2048899 RepID=UPI001F22A606|nr:hypothetical protein [Caulobacter sp. B11]